MITALKQQASATRALGHIKWTTEPGYDTEQNGVEVGKNMMAAAPMYACPSCGGSSTLKSSRQQTPTFRNVWFACKNPACGCTFAGIMELTHIISPSPIENPIARLPLRPVMTRRPGTAPRPANDDTPDKAMEA